MEHQTLFDIATELQEAANNHSTLATLYEHPEKTVNEAGVLGVRGFQEAKANHESDRIRCLELRDKLLSDEASPTTTAVQEFLKPLHQSNKRTTKNETT